MKTFYDLLDTNRRIQFTMRLRPLFKELPPVIEVGVNGRVLHSGKLQTSLESHGSFGIRENLSVSIAMNGKQYKVDSTSAVILESFVVDNFEIKDQMTQQSTYTHDSMSDHSGVTDHIGWNGRWEFTTGMPFYHFKHKVKNQGWLISPQ